MAGFLNIKEVVEAELGGAYKISTWRKTPSQTTASGFWFDLSMSPGNPNPQYYAAAPLKATAMSYSNDGGIVHGLAVSPAKKYLKRITALTVTATAVPMPMMLCDYLLYYPFVDMGSDTQQGMDNSVTIPRYTDGSGVQIMPVVVAAGDGVAATHTFTVSYTNSNGVSGRTTIARALTTQTVNGTLATSSSAGTTTSGPFLPLQLGDSGVRSIESCTVVGATDVGLICLVLVKPLAQMSIRGIDAAVEVEYLKDFSIMPEIKDDAYLNFICHPGGTLANAPIHGIIETIWG
jgi:hypothetical protein